MSQKLSAQYLYEFNEDLIESYNEKSNEGYFLKVDFQCSGNSHELLNNLPFNLKLVGNLSDEKEYIVHTQNLKQGLSQGLVLKQIHKVIKFYGKSSLKSHIDMNAELKKDKNRFWKIFLQTYE